MISTFDSDDVISNSNKANDHCRFIVNFLWGICHGEIEQLKMEIDHDDKDVEIWCNNRHNMCLLPLN